MSVEKLIYEIIFVDPFWVLVLMISLFINSNTTMMNVPTPQQQQVLDRHNDDKDRLNAFINDRWPGQQNDAPVVDADTCCLSVSTTLESTVFLLSIGPDSKFTYNSYSKDDENPWLISIFFPKNPDLASFIRQEWGEMFHREGLPNDGQNPINDIAPHVLFDATDALVLPQLINLTCDGNNVRANVRDIEVWSHPPRDEPLMAVINKNHECKQMLGHVKSSASQWINTPNDPNIPPGLIQQRQEERRIQTKRSFEKLYERHASILGPNNLPTSFQWPTIQLLESAGQNEQRYGGTAAGVYDGRDDESHNKFSNIGVQARNTMEDVFHALLPDVDFDVLMAKD